MRVRKICAWCGSAEIVCQGLAVWDEEQQEWLFDRQVDPEYCNECESFNIMEEEIENDA